MIEFSLYDKKGVPVHIGDVLKVDHYRAAQRREMRYMYKIVTGFSKTGDAIYCIISHLPTEKGSYSVIADGRRMENAEIVQGYGGVKIGQDFRDRPKQKQAKL